MSRYADRQVFFNNEEIYAKKAKERGIKGFVHYNSPSINKITSEDLASLVVQGHIWAEGDRYYKLAHQHYGFLSFDRSLYSFPCVVRHYQQQLI